MDMTYTEASVTCDAINALRRAIDMTGARPWATYEPQGDEADPTGPENEAAYRAALDTAHAKCLAAIEASS